MFNSWKTTGEFEIACSKFSMVDALDIRGRRCVVPPPQIETVMLWGRGREEGRQGWQGGRRGWPGSPDDATRSVHHRSTHRGHQAKNEQATPKGVTNASGPQAADDIDLFGRKAGGTGLGETVYAPAPAAVLPLNGSSGTTIRSFQLNQWRGIHGQTASPLAEFGLLSTEWLGRVCCGGCLVFVGDVCCLAGGGRGDDGRVGSNRLGWGGGRREVLDGRETRREERGVGHRRGDKL